MKEEEGAEGHGGDKRLTQRALKDCGYDATDVQACGYNYFLQYLEDPSLAVPLGEWSGLTTVALSSHSPRNVNDFEGPHPDGLRLGRRKHSSPRFRSSSRSCHGGISAPAAPC